MEAVLRNQWDLATDDNFKRRVEVAMCAAAIAIQGESGGTANHTNRTNYARLVLNAPEQYMPLFAMAICAYDSTLSASSADSTIQNGISAVWNALAGTV